MTKKCSRNPLIGRYSESRRSIPRFACRSGISKLYSCHNRQRNKVIIDDRNIVSKTIQRLSLWRGETGQCRLFWAYAGISKTRSGWVRARASHPFRSRCELKNRRRHRDKGISRIAEKVARLLESFSNFPRFKEECGEFVYAHLHNWCKILLVDSLRLGKIRGGIHIFLASPDSFISTYKVNKELSINSHAVKVETGDTIVV